MSSVDDMPIVPILLEGERRGVWLETAADLAYQDGLVDESIEVYIAYDDDPRGSDHMFIAVGEIWAGFGYTVRQACTALMHAKNVNAD